MKDNNIHRLKYAVIFLSGIVILLIGYLVYDNVFNVEKTEEVSRLLDLDKFSEYKNFDGTYGTIKQLRYESEEGRAYTINLGIDGSVYTGIYATRDNITNVDNVIDIIDFESGSGLLSDSKCYMLTDSGNVYVYSLGDMLESKYEATLLKDVKDVDKLVKIYYATSENASSLWKIIAILEDGNIIELDSDNG